MSGPDGLHVLLSSHGAGLYGAERVLLALGRGLTDRGHRVTVELPHDGPLVEAVEELRGLEGWETRRPRLPRNAAELVGHLVGAPAAVRRLRRGMGKRSPDVAWVNSIYNPWAATAARRADVPVVWHLHERNLPRPAGWLLSWWIRACAGIAVPVSRYVAESFTGRGLPASRVRVLKNPLVRRVEVASRVSDRPASRSGDRRLRIVCVGQLEPRKRVPDAIRAVARLPGARLVVVGDGKARERVEAVARRAGVRERVEFVGFQEEVGSFLAAADCVVIPAVREPFGLVALEAMAAGRPVVAAESGALPEVLGDAALYYPPGDVEALAGSLRTVEENGTLAGELVRRGRRRVRRFDTDRWLDAVEEILRRAMAGTGAGGGSR